MNPTQTQTTLAPIVAFLAGLLAGKGVFGFDTATWTYIIGGLAGIAGVVWGAIAARKGAIVQTANSLPEVKGIITTQTIAGRDLAQSIPGSTVVQAGTSDAKALATAGAAS